VKLKIAAISDTHRMHEDLTLDLEATNADILVHAGDADCTDEDSTRSFLHWLSRVADFFPEGALFTPGNHDTYFVGRGLDEFEPFLSPKVKIVINGEANVRGTRIYLSPFSFLSSPKHNAFTCFYEEALGDIWAQIPRGIDVLVTYSPPFEILAKNYGSISLKMRVMDIRPRVHIFGHVHEGHGQVVKDGIMFVNAASIGTIDSGPHVPLVVTVTDDKVTVSMPGELL
jgi:Icc-related predicted phosphoesterase